MNQSELREFYLLNSGRINDIVLQESQLRTLRNIRDYCEKHQATWISIEALRGLYLPMIISHPNMCTQLLRLWRKDYLDRKRISKPTGGCTYMYRINP